LTDAGRIVEEDKTSYPATRSAQAYRQKTHRPTRCLGCDNLPKANQLPREKVAQNVFPDDGSVHRTFQRWIELAVLDWVWAVLIENSQQLGSVDWQWQAADTVMAKALFTIVRDKRNILCGSL